MKQGIKVIPKENLIVRESFQLPYGGGEIWFEQLDALSIYTDLVKDKFLKDMESIRRPSNSAFIAVNLCETLVDQELADMIVESLIDVNRRIIKVAFVGLNKEGKHIFKSLLKKQDCSFGYALINDYEKAKQWLIKGN
jgi:hypothetical protein